MFESRTGVGINEALFVSALILFGVVKSEGLLARQARVKDLVDIHGVRRNSLVGYGLVIGLSGTGDSEASISTKMAALNMLKRFGVDKSIESLPPGNIAAVIVTAELPAFAKNGHRFDIRVSATGDSSSLEGGTLIRTLLKGVDQKVYAVAEGPILIGRNSGGESRSRTVASLPLGATVEREFTTKIGKNNTLQLNLKRPDFTTNDRVVVGINKFLRGFYAKSVDQSTIDVTIPSKYKGKMVQFISKLESVKVVVDSKAVVVVNERTGTVVLGGEVSIGPVTISHGTLSVQVGESGQGGQEKNENSRRIVSIPKPTVGDLVESLNSLGVKPVDLVAIIQAMHVAGAVNGELKFI